MTIKTLPLVLFTGAVAVAASAATSYLMAKEQPAPGSGDASASALERLADEVERVAARQKSLEGSLGELRAGSELVAPSSGRVSVGDIEAAVARWMDENKTQSRALAVAPETAAEAPEALEDRVAAAMERLDVDGLTDVEWTALWREFSEQGLTDELIAVFEARALGAPNDPEAHVAVAGAYLAKIFEVGNSPEAGLFATKADASFDRALELDDRHWEARFSKAMSLSFWPPMFGKQGEAIRQFEILAEQQSGMPVKDSFAQTHFLLGNMYRQIGEEEQAVAAWQRGLELFPNNEDLRGQLEIFSGQQ